MTNVGAKFFMQNIMIAAIRGNFHVRYDLRQTMTFSVIRRYIRVSMERNLRSSVKSFGPRTYGILGSV